MRYAHENLHDLLKSVHIQCAWNPLWKCVSLWLSKSFGRYANIENNNDGDGDGDGDGAMMVMVMVMMIPVKMP